MSIMFGVKLTPSLVSDEGQFSEIKLGYVHIDSCEFCHAEGWLVMFLAIDRVRKSTYVLMVMTP